MNKVRYISAICLLLCSLAVSAQTFERVYDNNFWNRSRNVTGVRQDSVSRSYAELYGGYESGEFRDTWQAEESWHAGAVTASIQHMDKMSLTGSFSFTQTEGYRQCGSMFINPGFYPVDILEFTPGRKTLQEYRFNGGISYDVASKWRIGARMDFESANISKKKDLRHMNYLLDMTVTPGFMYHDGDFAVGASAIFRKTSERIEAEQVGTSESSYYAFLDKGLMYGVHSVWNGSGLHLEESGVNGFPVKDFTYGGAVQLQYKGVFAELEYSETSGTVGEKEYIWFLFPGKEAKAMLGFRHNSGNETHLGRVNLGWKQRSLDENVLEKVSENGVATVICHGKNRIFTEGIWNLSPEYEYIADRIEFMEVKRGVYWSLKTRALTLYRVELNIEALFDNLPGLEGDIGICIVHRSLLQSLCHAMLSVIPYRARVEHNLATIALSLNAHRPPLVTQHRPSDRAWNAMQSGSITTLRRLEHRKWHWVAVLLKDSKLTLCGIIDRYNIRVDLCPILIAIV